LPEDVKLVCQLLVEELKDKGPYPGEGWPNYGKLRGKKSEDKRHCHLMKGKPTYVSCWEVVDKQIRLMEVYYVGTHEKTPY
jgi:hypothetical protein